MILAPVEYAVIAFEGTRLSEDVVAALRELVDGSLVHILDLVFIRKDDEGEVALFELDELPDDVADVFAELEHDVENLVSFDDLQFEAELIAAGESAIVVVWEDLWAKPLADAVRSAGGKLVDHQRVTAEAVAAAFADHDETSEERA